MIILFLGAIAAVVLALSAYVVPETEQVIVLQFGKPVGKPATEPGLHFKTPFVQTTYRVEKRILGWDGPATEMPTKDKLYIVVDCFARWKVTDPLLFLQRLRDYRSAQSRLDDILGSETRNTVAKNNLIEVIRTTTDRRPPREAVAAATAASADPALAAVTGAPAPQNTDLTQTEEPIITSGWVPISVGRTALEQEIFRNAKGKIVELGIELLDFRFKRINYTARVSEKIYERMISERNQIAEQFRSEGAGAAARINGERERTLLEIQSTAYRNVQQITGKADAQAARIFSDAYNSSDQSREFYEFTKTLDAYKTILTPSTNLLLGTDSDLFRLLKSPGAGAAGASSARPTD
jgi:membrane protease subunit HflC